MTNPSRGVPSVKDSGQPAMGNTLECLVLVSKSDRRAAPKPVSVRFGANSSDGLRAFTKQVVPDG
eukprot:2092180-Lingulodinium_polyedra.AAC.1